MQERKDIYRRLAAHLDDLPAGFPRTQSGVELRILRRLFTEEEAAMAVLLSVLPEGPESVAVRAGLPVAETARRLEAMSRKGLIYRMPDEGGGFRYMANQYVIGIWEYQVARLNPSRRDFADTAVHTDPSLAQHLTQCAIGSSGHPLL